MSESVAFQALKERYFAWLDASEPARAALLEAFAGSLASADYQALLGLIAQTEPTPLSPSDEQRTALAKPSSRVGDQFGPFRIRALLGGGGMGEVYLADRNVGGFSQQVALKLVRTEFASRSLLERFAREREILARLSHPNIAGLIDGGLHEGVPWFAMAYVEGRSLCNYLATHSLSQMQKLKLALQMAEALIEAHRKLVIHRDLKPANVMVTDDGIVKLLDFGIGKILDSSDAGATLTGLTPMTLRYASPEQLSGEPTSIGTDVFQLGLVLSEMLLGEPIRDERALANARSLALDLRAVLRQALAEKPGQRYLSASDFAADLRRLLANEPVQAMSAKWNYRFQRFVVRNRALSIAVVVALLAMGGGVASSLWQARQARGNAEALLRLLNVAAPQDFGTRENSLANYLIASAKQLEQDLASQPEFLAHSLTQIGNGLINLGQDQAAQAVLLRAKLAAERASFGAQDEFPILRLLAYTMEPPGPMTKAQALSETIRQKLLLTPCSEGLSAFAAITNTLSRHGDTLRVAANLAELASLRESITQTEQDQENLLRQLGKTVMREQNFPKALGFFAEALELYRTQPELFSAMRVAEGQALMAQAALAAGELKAAEASWRAAEAEFRLRYAIEDAPMREFMSLGRAIEKGQSSAPQ